MVAQHNMMPAQIRMKQRLYLHPTGKSWGGTGDLLPSSRANTRRQEGSARGARGDLVAWRCTARINTVGSKTRQCQALKGGG